MLKIIVSKNVEKFLGKIPTKHAQQIVSKIDKLAKNPYELATKKLQGFSDLMRVKSGEYRIIYKIKKDKLEIHILRI